MNRRTPDRSRLLAPLAPFALVSAAAASRAARAQESWPQKPVTIIVPQAPGGANDTVARAFGQRLSQAIGQPVVIEKTVRAPAATSAPRRPRGRRRTATRCC